MFSFLTVKNKFTSHLIGRYYYAIVVNEKVVLMIYYENIDPSFLTKNNNETVSFHNYRFS